MKKKESVEGGGGGVVFATFGKVNVGSFSVAGGFDSVLFLLRVSQLLLTAGTLGLAGWLACLAVSRLFVSVQPDDFRRV